MSGACARAPCLKGNAPSDHLRDDHDRIRGMVARIGAILRAPLPADLTHLLRLRWALLREIVQHLGREATFARVLREAPCAGAAMIADCFAEELTAIWSAYLDHLILCDEPDAIATDDYRVRFAMLSRVLHDRMTREEHWLHPLIDQRLTYDRTPSRHSR